MPPRRLVRAFVMLWWTSGVLLFVWSVQTVRASLGGGHGLHPHMALIGAIEAAAAVLFLVPRTLRLGAGGLLAVFLVAFALHLTEGQFRGDLLLYAAVVSFVAVHGPVSMAWLRRA